MDASKTIDFEAVKQYVMNHSSLADSERATFSESFGNCVLCKPSSSIGATPTDSMVGFHCIDIALQDNVS